MDREYQTGDRVVITGFPSILKLYKGMSGVLGERPSLYPDGWYVKLDNNTVTLSEFVIIRESEMKLEQS